MTIIEAYQAMREGKRVRRRGWSESWCPWICLVTVCGGRWVAWRGDEFDQFKASLSDIEATDWEVVP